MSPQDVPHDPIYYGLWAGLGVAAMVAAAGIRHAILQVAYAIHTLAQRLSDLDRDRRTGVIRVHNGGRAPDPPMYHSGHVG